MLAAEMGEAPSSTRVAKGVTETTPPNARPPLAALIVEVTPAGMLTPFVNVCVVVSLLTMPPVPMISADPLITKAPAVLLKVTEWALNVDGIVGASPRCLRR